MENVETGSNVVFCDYTGLVFGERIVHGVITEIEVVAGIKRFRVLPTAVFLNGQPVTSPEATTSWLMTEEELCQGLTKYQQKGWCTLCQKRIQLSEK